MGKSKSKNMKDYIRASEWKAEFGGKKDLKEIPNYYLPLNCCCLSLQPFTNPVCSPDGHIFDLENILKWLKEYGTSPVTGSPLKREDLITLHFHKNADGLFTSL
jgi:peptidyl-prolyl cis-trans isomerase-like protein 2